VRDVPTDLRYAWRRLRATPTFSITAVLTLALGIGTATAVFGVVDALTFRPVGGLDLDGVYAVTLRDTRTNRRIEIPWTAARALRRRAADAGVRVAMHAGHWTPHAKSAGRTEENVSAAAIGGDFASVHGLRAQVGRWLTAEDDDAVAGGHAAVISDRLWREWYGARTEVVGRDVIALRFSRATTTVRIVGVGAPRFRGLTPQTSFTDLWISHAAVSDGFAGQRAYDHLLAMTVHTIVRPPPQVHVTAAAASIKAMLAGAMPSFDRDAAVALTPVRQTLDVQSLSPLRVAALAVSMLVLVAACANLANMLLARGAHRAGEVAIRLALGASRLRIARVFVAEVAWIAGAAAGAGIGLAIAGLRIFANAVPAMPVAPGVTVTPDLSLSLRMVAYAIGVSAAASGVVGLIAAWRGSAAAPGRTVAGAGSAATPRARLLRTAMVSVQVTVALVLVMAAGLYLETMIVKLVERGLLGRRLNYDASHVVAGRVHLAGPEFSEARGRYFLDRALGEVRRLPDVERAALASGLPGGLRPLAPREMYLVLDDTAAPLAGHPGRGAAEYLSVSPGFLETIGLPIRRGRDFQHADGNGAERVAILSVRAADLLWPGQDPIGRRIAGPSNLLRTGDWMTVVGIVDEPVTPNHLAPYSAPSQFVFVPFAQHYTPAASIVVRTSRPDAMADPLRRAVRTVDPDVALLDVNTVESTVLAWLGPMRAATTLAGALAALALGIAALGVYAVMAFLTNARSREFGIRLALGATPRQVAKLVVDDAVRIVLIGLLPGVLLASWGSRYLDSRAFGIMPNSITNWVVVPVVVLAAGIVAAYLPARRASRTDPTLTLRAE
jgi:predicted permease